MLILSVVAVKCWDWDWPWSGSGVEQSGLINTVIQKSQLSHNENLGIQLKVVVHLLTWLNNLTVAIVIIQLIICTIGVGSIVRSCFNRQVDKKAKKQNKSNSAAC